MGADELWVSGKGIEMSTAFANFGRPFRRDETCAKRGVYLERTLRQLRRGEARKDGACIFCGEPSGAFRSHFPTLRNDAAVCTGCCKQMDALAGFVAGLLRAPAVTRSNSRRLSRYHLLLRAFRSLAASMPSVAAFKDAADELAAIDILGTDLRAQNLAIERATIGAGCVDLAVEIARLSELPW